MEQSLTEGAPNFCPPYRGYKDLTEVQYATEHGYSNAWADAAPVIDYCIKNNIASINYLSPAPKIKTDGYTELPFLDASHQYRIDRSSFVALNKREVEDLLKHLRQYRHQDIQWAQSKHENNP